VLSVEHKEVGIDIKSESRLKCHGSRVKVRGEGNGQKVETTNGQHLQHGPLFVYPGSTDSSQIYFEGDLALLRCLPEIAMHQIGKEENIWNVI